MADTAPDDDVQSFGCSDPTPLPSTIPKEMKRLIVTSPGNGTLEDCKIEIETVPTPTPTYGQVLIKVVAAPVNPSDYRSWYKSRPTAYPMPIGSEGSGIVIATGGILPDIRCPVGTNVGFLAMSCDELKQGSYSEYVVANALTEVFPMPADVPIEDCASFFVNPYTAVGISIPPRLRGRIRLLYTLPRQVNWGKC